VRIPGSTAQTRERKADIARFLSDPEINSDVLKKYNISYVYVWNNGNFPGDSKRASTHIVCYSDLGTKKIRKYRKSYRLEVVFENKDYLIFKVHQLEERDGKRLFNKYKSISRNEE
jgi:hypothetical protein